MRLVSAEFDAHSIMIASLHAGGVRHLVAHQPPSFGVSVRSKIECSLEGVGQADDSFYLES